MADELTSLFGNLDFAGMGGGVLDVVSIVFFAAVVIGALLFVLNWMQYKHRVYVLYKTSGQDSVLEDKAKIYIDDDGKEVWRLWKSRKNVPCPPKEARFIMKNGKFAVMAYYSDETGFTFQLNFKEQIASDVLTSNQKMFWMNQHKKAILEKKTSILDIIRENAGLMVIVIMLVVVLVTWGDVTLATKETLDKANAVMETTGRVADKLDTIINNRQNIGPESPRPD